MMCFGRFVYVYINWAKKKGLSKYQVAKVHLGDIVGLNVKTAVPGHTKVVWAFFPIKTIQSKTRKVAYRAAGSGVLMALLH